MIFHIAWTIALIVAFLAIFFWAWSNRRQKDFTEAARLPLEDDEFDVPAGIAAEAKAKNNKGNQYG